LTAHLIIQVGFFFSFLLKKTFTHIPLYISLRGMLTEVDAIFGAYFFNPNGRNDIFFIFY